MLAGRDRQPGSGHLLFAFWPDGDAHVPTDGAAAGGCHSTRLPTASAAVTLSQC